MHWSIAGLDAIYIHSNSTFLPYHHVNERKIYVVFFTSPI